MQESTLGSTLISIYLKPSRRKGSKLLNCILAQARKTPSAIAVVDKDRQFSYIEIATLSYTIAQALWSRGVRPGQAVAVSLPRSYHLVCAMLAILRLGAIVVPLDQQSPHDRILYMLTDSSCVAVIHDDEFSSPRTTSTLMLHIRDLLSAWEPEADDQLESFNPEISFIFYTSGTTGRPKGVEITDVGILRLSQLGYIKITADDRYACISNPAFDAMSFETWVPLVSGGCCVIFEDDEVKSPQKLQARLTREGINTLFITSALFNSIIEQCPTCFSTISQVLIGGEQLNPKAIRTWYRENSTSNTQLFNVYGPTETTTFALSYAIPRTFDGSVVPIGQALPGTGLLLVVDQTRLADTDEVAELHLSGEGLARGYRNLTQETDSKFVQLQWFDKGAILFYRTGDLVRRNVDGVIEYVGRRDRQVKVRGYRIEPGEIEQKVLLHPAIRQVYVYPRRDGETESTELLAYLVLQDEISLDDFEKHLIEYLPKYMRPHWTFLVDSLPINSNGKVDSAELIQQAKTPWKKVFQASDLLTPWQIDVFSLMSRVLNVTQVEPGDNWIANGGDSLKALRLCFEVQRRWGFELPQTKVFEQTLNQLAQYIGHARSQLIVTYPEVSAVPTEHPVPATYEQQRLWFIQQQSPLSTAYNVPVIFRLDGEIDFSVLRQALCGLVKQHIGLRTAFTLGSDGLQQILAEPYDPTHFDISPVRLDESGWRAFVAHICAAPFDLSVPQLFQAYWLPTLTGNGLLLLHMHHIVVDGWSLNILFKELSARYAYGLQAFEYLDDISVSTPMEYGIWQEKWFSTANYKAQRTSLLELYVKKNDIDAPFFPKGVSPNRLTMNLRENLGAERRDALDCLGIELGLTRFQILISVFSWSIFGVTGHVNPLIASPVANRPLQDFEASVGMFANTVLIPMKLFPSITLKEALLLQAKLVRAVLQYQEVALTHVLCDASVLQSAGASPFDFLFVLENTDFSSLKLDGCDVMHEWLSPSQVKCPMTLYVLESKEDLYCVWEYAEEHFSTQQALAMSNLFRQGVDALLTHVAIGLADLVLPYRRTLPQLGEGPVVPLLFDRIYDWFAYQSRCTPWAVAVLDRIRSLSYAQLDAHVTALADELFDCYTPTLEVDTPLCAVVCFDASIEHIVTLLALARLNITIVTLDPSSSIKSIQYILEQVQPVCILIPSSVKPLISQLKAHDTPVHVVALGQIPRPRVERIATNTGRPLYTLFTSGSTGIPKGVEVFDKTLCNLLQWQRESGGLAVRASTMQFSMLSFDVSFQEIFSTLCSGACLHLISPHWRQDVQSLLTYMEQSHVERIFMPYVALQVLAESGVATGRYPPSLREVITAGEQLLCTDVIKQWFERMPHSRLFNHYGPTETHVVSSMCLADKPSQWALRAPIGRAVANATLLVVDAWDMPVPVGCHGYLLVSGLMATPCYLNDSALNRSRFVDLATGSSCVVLRRFYRTGDLVYFDCKGLLHYVGRDDEQVKLSGHRLELGQLEAALLKHPAVVGAVVILDPASKQLIANVQFGNTSATPEELRSHLAPLVPAYAVMGRFRSVQTMPRTASGKLDRRKVLQAHGEDLIEWREDQTSFRMSPLEIDLSAIFKAVIGQSIGLDQSFFDAGATSLSLMRFHLRSTSQLGRTFSIADLFEQVTIRRLANFLNSEGSPRPAARSSAARLDDSERIAVVGIAVNLPGAGNLAEFWQMVKSGTRGMFHFIATDGKVGVRSQMDGILNFDPEYFGIGHQEARLMDPQQRQLLMCSVQALANAGIAQLQSVRVGLVASCGENTYFQTMLRRENAETLPDNFQMALHHEKDFLATKVAFHLNLTGPALTVQAACASSLVGVHLAANLLRNGDSDVMLVGGVLIDTTLTDGYHYRPQHIFSSDGHCRPFSDDASGTIGGSGVAVVVLKPYHRALLDGDEIYAVVAGSAINNDGATKLGYTAPSISGQREVIDAALHRSGYSSGDIGYVEAHGTATQLGDPIEVQALQHAFGISAQSRCALSSVKSQIGHLGAAAGVTGLVRAVLAVQHGSIPPNLDFHRLNPSIGLNLTPFYIPTEAIPWPAGCRRVAAVSSFGIGGTNAHVIVDQGSESRLLDTVMPCIFLSGNSSKAIQEDAVRIANYLEAYPLQFNRVIRHLQAGRLQLRWRMASVFANAEGAVAWLRQAVAIPTTISNHTKPLHANANPEQILVDGWLVGKKIQWTLGTAQAPWDFPPPSFDLDEYNFEQVSHKDVIPTSNLFKSPPEEWLFQRQWVRLRRISKTPLSASNKLLVVLVIEPLSAPVLHTLRDAYRRVVQLVASKSFSQIGEDDYRADPTDAQSLGIFFEALDSDHTKSIDWLHALPLSINGKPSETSAERARWACLDSAAALLQAWEGAAPKRTLHIWWLSYLAQAVTGPVARPELGLLTGANEVIPQEYPVRCHWIDLQTCDIADSLPALLSVLTDPKALPRRLALRDKYVWQSSLSPVPLVSSGSRPDLLVTNGTYLIIGGTGGIGCSIAAYILTNTRGRVILLSRQALLPDTLKLWSDRIRLIAADVTCELESSVALALLKAQELRIDGVVHAVGVGTGTLVALRDAAAFKHSLKVKTQAALLVEAIIYYYKPAFSFYCSSMSSLFGGVGQIDYAASNGALDGFANFRTDEQETTIRMGVNWDVWRDVGMATKTLQNNAQHQAHLSIGLSEQEGMQVFEQALLLQLPQLLVSTTPLNRAREFYEKTPSVKSIHAGFEPEVSIKEHLVNCLCRWLGLDILDASASLYELGLNSLMLLDLIDEVRAKCGVDISLSRLSHKVSLTEILSMLVVTDEMHTASVQRGTEVTLEIWQKGSGDHVLCLIHPVGGDIQAYRFLVSFLDPSLTVCLIIDPLLYSDQPIVWSIKERASSYLHALQQKFPYEDWRWHLGGWSYGALVAAAMCSKSEADGRPLSQIYLIDPPLPGTLAQIKTYSVEQLKTIFSNELELRAFEVQNSSFTIPGHAFSTKENPEKHLYLERLALCCQANINSMLDFPGLDVTTAIAHFFMATKEVPNLPPNEVTTQEQKRLWREFFPNIKNWLIFEATHYEVIQMPYVHAIAQAINMNLLLKIDSPGSSVDDCSMEI